MGVAGAADCDENTYSRAESVGRAIANRGGVLLCGGRLGVMEAAAKGACETGGSTIGILPGADRTEANEYIKTVICTGLGQARNVVFVLSCDVLIAVGGEYGTLSEIAIALKHGIPVVGYHSWEVASLDEEPRYIKKSDPEKAVEAAYLLAKQFSSIAHNISKND